MAGRSEPPLDEIQWRSSELAQSMGGIHTNTVLPYFSQSPFFDVTSNNATLTTQATYNQSMIHLLQTRDAFEGRLKSMQGLEFMVASGPDPNSSFQPGEESPWVIRKQNRRKRPGDIDEITVQATFFVMGENVYMSPSVGKVLESRLLSTITSLTDFFAATSKLPSFSPANGYTYPPTASSSQKANISFSTLDKEDTVMGDDASQTKAVNSDTRIDQFPSSKSKENQDMRMLWEAFQLSTKYQDEYLDECTLVGEPGKFILSAKGGQKEAVSQEAPKPAVAPTPQPQPQPAKPAPISVTIPPTKPSTGAKDKSPTSGSKPRRRKSKAAPISAGTVGPS
ncbi:MAG: Mediator of RNA polymerase II transcription subunit 6 [Vezdaea aestivalis]|nr:MAG: Mediator of RNA polymerase II transcription subunit 6 [Vezdaea aestivalis]